MSGDGAPAEKKAMIYTRRTDAELETLAQDIVAGRVFTSMAIPVGQERMLGGIFMPLGFCDTEALKEFERLEVSLFYEEMHKAAPRSVNGFPTFFSLKFLDIEDHKKLLERLVEVQKFMDSRKEEAAG